MTSFDLYSLRPETRAALALQGIETPTPIQTAALPELLAGKDVIGQARTGSGKTLAFVLPLLERVDEQRAAVQALVLAPTRELAAQVASVATETAGGRPVRVLLIVGGVGLGTQRLALARGVHVVVGTPGRVLDHIRQGTLKLNQLRLLVLDEADEMLDRGFAPDVERIIATTNPARQTALFSATVPDWVQTVAAKHLRAPVTVQVDVQSQPLTNVSHAIYDVPAGGKMAALQSLLDARGQGGTLVFGRTKHGVKKLAKQLEALGYAVGALQGNLSQNARDKVMDAFRSGETPILVATNVAARGIDVDHLDQVINYELPETADLLTHRVGRTGRMGREGEAITLLTPDDEDAWKKLARTLRRHPVRLPWRGAHLSTLAAALDRVPTPPRVRVVAPPTPEPEQRAPTARPTQDRSPRGRAPALRAPASRLAAGARPAHAPPSAQTGGRVGRPPQSTQAGAMPPPAGRRRRRPRGRAPSATAS